MTDIEPRVRKASKRQRTTAMKLSAGTEASRDRPHWKKQLAAIKANANRKDRRR